MNPKPSYMYARPIFLFGLGFSIFIILPLPSMLYYFTRVVLFILFIYGWVWLQDNVNQNSQSKLFFFAPIAFLVLFNPIIPVYLYYKGFWTIFNLAAAYWFYTAAQIAKEKDIETPPQ